MKLLKLFFLFILISFNKALACDDFLKLEQSNPRRAELFSRDCKIQDRYSAIKSFFEMREINVEELAEYRMLRFFDRKSFDYAAKNAIKPSDIYKPAPQTFEVWDLGIRSLFKRNKTEGLLFLTNGFNTNTKNYEYIHLSKINAVLLSNIKGNISRNFLEGKNTKYSVPGVVRKSGDPQLGFTIDYYPTLIKDIYKDRSSIQALQNQWEQDYGKKFKEIVLERRGLRPDIATFNFAINVKPKKSTNLMSVSYSKSEMVPLQLSWILTFINVNIERYREGLPLMPPIEFSAFVQKWLVSIHPFSDGNGRTSRAVQDFILSNFKMPYAPGGDLQNDTLEEYNKYVDKTYEQIEKMLSRLEMCMKEYKQENRISYQCQEIKNL